MEFNVRQFKKYAARRKEDLVYEAKPIGSAIKMRRKELKMTLEEGSEGICSVSYLSKLENNQIECNEQFLEKLLERFSIKEDYASPDPSYQKDLNHLLESLFHHDVFEIDLDSSYHDRIDHQALLLRMGYHFTRKEYQKTQIIYDDIKSLMTVLSDLEFSLIILMIAEMLYHKERYQDAFEITKIAIQIEDIPEMIYLLIQSIRIKIAFKLKHFETVLNDYHKFISTTMNNYHMHLFEDIKRKSIEFESEFVRPEILKRKISHIKKLSNTEKLVSLIKSHYHHQSYEMACELAAKEKNFHPEIKIYQLLALDALEQKETILKTIESIPSSSLTSEALNKLIKHLLYKYTFEKSQIIHYLRHEVIGLNHLTDHMDVLKYLMYDTQSLFSSFQYYKEANQTITELMPKIKALKMA